MNSDTRRILSNYDSSYDIPERYQAYYAQQGNLWQRIADNPAVLVPTVLLALTVLYQIAAQSQPLPPLGELLWTGLVSIIPAKLLYAIDHWRNPPLFPRPSHMLQTQTASVSHAAKSEVLRRLLGLDKPGGLMMSVSEVGRRGFSTLSSATLGTLGHMKSALPDRPAGLGNYDNSCYQNSILQGLAALKPVPEYLSSVLSMERSQGRPITTAAPTARTTDTLRDLIRDLNDVSNNGKTLWTPGVLKNMSTWQQQDAQEYFSKLLDEIDKEISKAARAVHKPSWFSEQDAISKDDAAASQHSDDSGYQSLSTTHSKTGAAELGRTIRNPLEGMIAQRVACVACGYSEGLTMIPFNCITLNLGVNQAQHDLYERLDSYTRVESIQGVECARCTLLKIRRLLLALLDRNRQIGKTDDDVPEFVARLAAIEDALEEDAFDDETLAKRCHIKPQQMVSSTKTKQAVIARPPQSLVIHMNRSVFDETSGEMWKNLAAVKFPMTLDLGPWCLGSAPAPPEREENGDEEQWLLDPTLSMVAGDQNPSRISGPIYELRAVVTHYGRHDNGHYICHRRHPRTPRGKKEAGDDEKPPPQLASSEHAEHQDEVDHDEGVSDTVEPQEGKLEPTAEDDEDDDWWRLSDQDVTKVDEQTVLAQGGVFMLFYDCIDSNSVLITDDDGDGEDEFVDAP
ncbi:cysteine proteinase, partial [Diplogelasinospora grovesii]